MNKILEVNNVTKTYKKVVALEDVSIEMFENEVLVILGPSGSGKTTLLRVIANLEKANSGTIKLFDNYILKDDVYEKNKMVKENLKNVGLIFQDFNLFDNLSVLKNITLAMTTVLGFSKEEANDKAKALLALVSLSEKQDAYPSELSGGQKQRIAIIRALALSPRILLLDEPTSALDVLSINELINIIKMLKEKGISMIVVTHDVNFAQKIATRIITMNKGQISTANEIMNFIDK